MEIKVKPFLKWVGGKSVLINEIEKKYNDIIMHIDTYIEPFVGGGAILFHILSNYNNIKKIYISDKNEKLINTYSVIKYNVNELIKILDSIQNYYISLNEMERKKYYYKIREDFNVKLDENNSIMMAAYFIFLNRTCFNGLYRVNKKDEFNVPMGSYKRPVICDKENLTNISNKLKNVVIYCSDFKKSIEYVTDRTLIYFDPPYRPISKNSSFTSYTKYDFNDSDQVDLANFVLNIDKLGAKFILSNSDPKNIDKSDNFFDELYKKFDIDRVYVKRRINSDGTKRGDVSEILVSNIGRS